MSWALVATAAAGLNAGSGLHCVLVESHKPPFTDLASVEAYWNVFRTTSGPKITLSSGLAAISAGAALAAYLSSDTPDPAWITCSLINAAIPLYNLMALTPTAAVVSNPAMADQPYKERESWVGSFARKHCVSAGLAAAAFGCMLLVLGAGEPVGGQASSNPLRFTR